MRRPQNLATSKLTSWPPNKQAGNIRLLRRVPHTPMKSAQVLTKSLRQMKTVPLKKSVRLQMRHVLRQRLRRTRHPKKRASLLPRSLHPKKRASLPPRNPHPKRRAILQLRSQHRERRASLPPRSQHRERRASLRLRSQHRERRASLPPRSLHRERRASLPLRSLHPEKRVSLRLRSLHRKRRASLLPRERTDPSAIRSLHLPEVIISCSSPVYRFPVR